MKRDFASKAGTVSIHDFKEDGTSVKYQLRESWDRVRKLVSINNDELLFHVEDKSIQSLILYSKGKQEQFVIKQTFVSGYAYNKTFVVIFNEDELVLLCDHHGTYWRRNNCGLFEIAQSFPVIHPIMAWCFTKTYELIFSYIDGDVAEVWRKNKNGFFELSQTLDLKLIWCFLTLNSGELLTQNSNFLCLWRKDPSGNFAIVQKIDHPGNSETKMLEHTTGDIFCSTNVYITIYKKKQ